VHSDAVNRILSHCGDAETLRFVMTGSRVRVKQAAAFSQVRRTAADAGFSVLQTQQKRIWNRRRRTGVASELHTTLSDHHRVLPALGQPQAWPKPRRGGGTALLYRNYLRRFWSNPLKRLGFANVTPHSARHSYISTLQAEGIEIALVAKVVGHANPAITASHYSHAVRGSGIVGETLERAFASSST
jgi:integrase